MLCQKSEVSSMTRNARRARAIAITQAKPDNRMAVLRYLMLAAGATAASLALLLAHFL
ncbi:hypothetical protein AMC79_CH00754 [Rhizobium phaseoli]|nr:hypothetical protein AMC89_CH00756 [Rhizobium phaseoli]ANL96590.1 hypothetical protein AMC79_CH00754 [Rhizobium phaseoli]ANM02898.1 hypothetical protein AMC78_CH00756 [Rhizobium phaseoli]